MIPPSALPCSWPGSVLPKPIEAVRGQLRIPDGVGDILVAEVLLDCPRIVSVVCQLVPAGMAQHMGVHREGNPRQLTSPRDDLADIRGRHWPLALTRKDIGAVLAKFSQCPQLRTPQGLR